MTEHEQLKEICKKIWYDVEKETDYEWDFYYYIQTHNGYDSCSFDREIQAREIIFTQEFMNKMEHYYLRYIDEDCDETHSIVEIMAWLGANLNNPVEYLYNLIK